jgi:hypothetical protein
VRPAALDVAATDLRDAVARHLDSVLR